MNASAEFHKFSRQFHADIELYPDPFLDSIQSGLASLNEDEKDSLKKYFSDVLKKDLSDDALEDLWTDSPSDILLNGPGVRFVMKETLKVL